MNILITGGAGFIASHIQDAYINKGHNVVVIDNLSTGEKKNINSKSVFYNADITKYDEVNEIIKNEKIELINHHAAQMNIRVSVENPSLDAKANILGSINLLEACRNNNVNKIIFSSTGGAIYGEQESFPANEDHPLYPLSPYGVAKLTVEKYLYYYDFAYGIKSTIFRYANVFGPRQNPHGEAGVIAIFFEKFINDQKAIINGDGKQTRDFIFVDDIVRANLLALNNNKSCILNLGTGVEKNIIEVYDHVSKVCNHRNPPNFDPPKTGEQLRSVLSIDRAKDFLNWEPKIDFETGISLTADYYNSI